MKSVLHVTPEDIAAWLRGDLDDDETAGVWTHCQGCDSCREELLQAHVVRWAFVQRQLVARTAKVTVAVVGAAVIAASLAREPHREPSGVVPPALHDELPITDPVARLSGDDARVTYFGASRLIMATNHLQTLLAAIPAVAGTDADDTAALVEGLAAIGIGDASAAAEALARFGRRYDPHGTPLLGVSLYAAGNDDAAATEILSAIAFSSTPEEIDGNVLLWAAHWYLGKLALRRGDLIGARAAWERVADPSVGSYRSLAAAGLVNLPDE